MHNISDKRRKNVLVLIRQSYFCVFIYSLLLALLILVMAARPVVVYTFQVGAPFSNKNAKFWPVLVIYAYFVINLCFFWCPFYRPKKLCGGAPKLKNMRCGCLSIVGQVLCWPPISKPNVLTLRKSVCVYGCTPNILQQCQAFRS